MKSVNQAGFTAIELLITLFVAAAFLVSGYQLYTIIIKDSGNTRAQSRASNVAYDYMRRYSTSAVSPCVASTPLNSASINVSNISAVTITVALSCPYSAVPTITKVTATVNYNNPQQTVTYATYVKK